MIDPVSVGIAVALLGTGWLIGRHGRLKSRPKQPEPWCLCEHHYGAHDPETGECLASELRSRYTDAAGRHDVDYDCPCARYTGPEPIQQYWVPPAADMSIVTAPREIQRDRA